LSGALSTIEEQLGDLTKSGFHF